MEIAGLATIKTVVESVLTQANVVFALAEATKLVAKAASFFLIAIEADKFISHAVSNGRFECRAATLARTDGNWKENCFAETCITNQRQGHSTYAYHPVAVRLQSFYDVRMVRAYRNEVLWKVILASWGIAFFEYCLQVPANRIGYGEFSAGQLKVIQEVITLLVFGAFSVLYLGERLKWNYGAAVVCLVGAAFFMFHQ